MINDALLSPRSIVVVGGSDNVTKPGGKIVRNILDGGYDGDLYVINPGSSTVQGVASYTSVEELPDDVDLAILAVAARFCPKFVEDLGKHKSVKAFIVISAGFSEEGHEGADLENALRTAADKVGASLVGPNCIGVITPRYNGVFTAPVPKLNPNGCDFVSGGAGKRDRPRRPLYYGNAGRHQNTGDSGD